MNEKRASISMGDAARELKVTKARVSQLIASDDLEGVLRDGRRFVYVDSLESYQAAKRLAARKKKAADYVLMSGDYEVAEVTYDNVREIPLTVQKIIDPSRMPFGAVTSNDTVRPVPFNSWWSHRSVPNTRGGVTAKLADLGLSNTADLPLRNLGLSLSDCYWLRPKAKSDLTWDAINYFDNDFEDSDSGAWDEWLGGVGLDSPDNTSEGELPKRWAIRGGERVLIKGCGMDDQRPFNEVVATALYERLLEDSDYVPYETVRVNSGPACLCPDFIARRQEYIPAMYLKERIGQTRGTSAYDRFARYAGAWVGDEELVRTALSKMIVCDAIIANTDRHWRNFGFVRSIDTLCMAPAPLFDSGNCLWYATPVNRLEEGDWSFASRPFEVDPKRQLALADRFDWFDPARLEGFVDEAIEILSGSESATRDGRLDLLAHGLARRVSEVSAAVETLRHVPR